MNWYKLAKTHLITKAKELDSFLTQKGFFRNRYSKHIQWCHKEMPAKCVHIEHQKSGDLNPNLVEYVIGNVYKILDEIEAIEAKKREEAIAKQVEELMNQNKWKNEPWYQEQLKYRTPEKTQGKIISRKK